LQLFSLAPQKESLKPALCYNLLHLALNICNRKDVCPRLAQIYALRILFLLRL
jgi:hypothetical protein